MSATVVLKAKKGEDLRRFTIDRAISYNGIVGKLASVFNVPANLVQLSYVDNDGDKIIASNDDEWTECVNHQSSSGNLVRVTVTQAKKPVNAINAAKAVKVVKASAPVKVLTPPKTVAAKKELAPVIRQNRTPHKKCQGHGKSCPVGIVQSVYRSELKRVGEPAGVKYWVDCVMKKRGLGHSDDQVRKFLVERFRASSEYQKKFGTPKPTPKPTTKRTMSPNDLVQEAYKVHLKRVGEPAGVKYWIEEVEKRPSHTEEQIRSFLKSRFLASVEYREKFGDMKKTVRNGNKASDEEMVQTVYRSILKRVGEREGVDHWLRYVRMRRSMGHCDKAIKKWLEECFVGSDEYKKRARESKSTVSRMPVKVTPAVATAKASCSVSVNAVKAAKPVKAEVAPEKVVHRTVICDACFEPNRKNGKRSERLTGIRFKCGTCPNYDLCEKHFKESLTNPAIHDQDHVFMVLPKPVRGVSVGITTTKF